MIENCTKHGLKAMTLFLIMLLSSCSTKQPQGWAAWDYFKKYYISIDGRVIDPSDSRKITTSEGQSYALFFALVANDPQMFDKLLKWTEINLASGDLSNQLPAWLWGKNNTGKWTIIDKNSASDADVWIAYDLIEAGRLWNNPQYQQLGLKVLAQIANQEVIHIPGIGSLLLPWKKELTDHNHVLLNPSYAPPQLLERFANLPGPWHEMTQTNARFLIETAPKGFAPDWVIWDSQKSWLPSKEKPYVGSYDAIRVYLWTGMLANDYSQKSLLLKHFEPMMTLIEGIGLPPRIVYTDSGKTQGEGSIGFSAALLPFLANNHQVLNEQRKRVDAAPLGPDAYYDSVLRLFGQGFDEHRFSFDKNGSLLTSWKN